MDVRIQAVNFEIADKLVEFINKKADKLARRYPEIQSIDVYLKVAKAETAMNKEITVKILAPHVGECVANKTADTFEEAYDNSLDALEKQLAKDKEKR